MTILRIYSQRFYNLQSCLEQPSCGGLDLGAFLLTPVQRIPRYILLLKQLLKYTDESHPDFHHVNICLDRLKDFLERLNDSIEHSFQLVHATFSPGGLADSSLAVTIRRGRYEIYWSGYLFSCMHINKYIQYFNFNGWFL